MEKWSGEGFLGERFIVRMLDENMEGAGVDGELVVVIINFWVVRMVQVIKVVEMCFKFLSCLINVISTQ